MPKQAKALLHSGVGVGSGVSKTKSSQVADLGIKKIGERLRAMVGTVSLDILNGIKLGRPFLARMQGYINGSNLTVGPVNKIGRCELRSSRFDHRDWSRRCQRFDIAASLFARGLRGVVR